MQALTVALPTMVKRGQRYQEIPAGPSACDTFTTVCLTYLFLFTKDTATAFSGTARSGTNDMEGGTFANSCYSSHNEYCLSQQ